MEFNGQPGGAVGAWDLKKSSDSWSWSLYSDPSDKPVRVGAGPAHVLAVNTPRTFIIATANYASGSWNVFGQFNRGKPLQMQERWGEGCRNGTSHPHETVK